MKNAVSFGAIDGTSSYVNVYNKIARQATDISADMLQTFGRMPLTTLENIGKIQELLMDVLGSTQLIFFDRKTLEQRLKQEFPEMTPERCSDAANTLNAALKTTKLCEKTQVLDSYPSDYYTSLAFKTGLHALGKTLGLRTPEKIMRLPKSGTIDVYVKQANSKKGLGSYHIRTTQELSARRMMLDLQKAEYIIEESIPSPSTDFRFRSRLRVLTIGPGKNNIFGMVLYINGPRGTTQPFSIPIGQADQMAETKEMQAERAIYQSYDEKGAFEKAQIQDVQRQAAIAGTYCAIEGSQINETEFLYDTRIGKWKVIDVNPRPNFVVPLSTATFQHFVATGKILEENRRYDIAAEYVLSCMSTVF